MTLMKFETRKQLGELATKMAGWVDDATRALAQAKADEADRLEALFDQEPRGLQPGLSLGVSEVNGALSHLNDVLSWVKILVNRRVAVHVHARARTHTRTRTRTRTRTCRRIQHT